MIIILSSKTMALRMFVRLGLPPIKLVHNVWHISNGSFQCIPKAYRIINPGRNRNGNTSLGAL